jgi:hypothetical protein
VSLLASNLQRSTSAAGRWRLFMKYDRQRRRTPATGARLKVHFMTQTSIARGR